MHTAGCILAVKNSQNQTLRESGRNVYLPFHSEYKLFLKNTTGYRCGLKVFIDGTDVLGGNLLILNQNQDMDLERFMLDGDFGKGKKFKFVPLGDSRVSDPTSSSNGQIRVEFYREVVHLPNLVWTSNAGMYSSGNVWGFGGPRNEPQSTATKVEHLYRTNFTSAGKRSCSTLGPEEGEMPYAASTNISFTSQDFASAPQNYVSEQCCGQKGATVEGDLSSQQFTIGGLGTLEHRPTILILNILAPKEDQPTTVQDTRYSYCVNCGKKMKHAYSFCPNCGTPKARE